MLWRCDRMSKDYEEKLLEDIIETAKEEYIWVGKGGARIVVDHPYDENKVVKIAIGIGGMKQIHNEVTTYNGYADQVSLATIYSYSDLLEEMIRVQPIDGDDDLPDYNYNDDINDDDEDEDDAEFTTTEYTRSDFWDLVDSLDAITGATGDNEQIGLDANGSLVAYDYGFFVYNNCSHDQTSPMRDCHWTNDFLIEYLTELLEVIRGNRSIQDVEEEFINTYYDNGDDEDFNCDSWYNDTDMENYDPDNYCENNSREDSDYESDYSSAEDSDE